MTVFRGLMKIAYLTTIVVASALSLASANAMPDLGRETGKFIHSDEPTPKGVRTFEPAKSGDSQVGVHFLAPWRHQAGVTFLAPVKPQASLAFLTPWNHPASLTFLAPVKPQTGLSFLAPVKPNGNLSFLTPWNHPSPRIA
jgi:hypothetical protein